MTTSTRDSETLPGAHPNQPVPTCARCYGATYGAALAVVIETMQQDDQPLVMADAHEQADEYVTQATSEPVLCPLHQRMPKPRWTREHIEYARTIEDAWPGRRVVGVVINDDGEPVDGAFNATTCVLCARTGLRVIVVSDCYEEDTPAESIQRRCDTHYRLVVPR